MFSYEKITQLNESTTPFMKRRPKTPFRKGGGGGHTPRMKKPHLNESNVKNVPFRSHSRHKVYICREKTPSQATRTTLNSQDKITDSKVPRGKTTDLSGFVRNVKKPHPA